MKVLITASECAPLVKVGGIADVVGSLPIVLQQEGIDVRVAIPYYKPLKEKLATSQEPKPEVIFETNIKYGTLSFKVTVYETLLPNSKVPVYLIDNPELISNGGIYFSPETMPSPESEIERFAFFSKAIAELFTAPQSDENLSSVLSSVFATQISNFFVPDIIHCNDWHTGMVPQIIQNSFKYVQAKRVKTIFTIHNLAYQGFSRIEVAEKLGLNISQDKTLNWDSKDDNLDFILQGIVGADFINTVSERYAQEIQTPEYGEGLQDILKARESRLTGVLNGISYEIFNPQTDTFLYKQYGLIEVLQGKAENKKRLQESLGLKVNPDKPLLGLVSRLAHQKGLDLVAESVHPIIQMGYQVVLLGTGDPFIETKFSEHNENPLYKNDFKACITFSEEMARKIYAASDMFLIPSRFEPCGLTQMIAMKYGSVPVVRATGGLYDTVQNYETGFTYEALTSDAMLAALQNALTTYTAQKSKWNKIVVNCMNKDFSWKESARKYINLYRKVLSV